ncbi:Mut7-C RNAse domain-containing protein [Pontibacter litorisediminis]|uniref:Mut7-C RNAse domain-containing protein n=1 Tax=Pontibacter litorisediminis TaxID=1846260 RepID=UPI0023EDF468|nr:Mut7-C RNAse domain-containing protein [Pontibacter litorisediminis]
MNMQPEQIATFQFHGALNDFLPKHRKGQSVRYSFRGNPAVKDAMEAMGVPHPEVDVVLVNNKPVTFSYLLLPDDVVEVFPVERGRSWPTGYTFEENNPPPHRFILDVHLGTLAKSMRMLGLDTRYQTDFSDADIARIAAEEQRVVLTRDIGLLKQKNIAWGYWLRSQHTQEQLEEVIHRYQPQDSFRPFALCLACNVPVQEVAKDEVLHELPPKTKEFFHEFYRCPSCRRVYWKGSHYERMQQQVAKSGAEVLTVKYKCMLPDKVLLA